METRVRSTKIPLRHGDIKVPVGDAGKDAPVKTPPGDVKAIAAKNPANAACDSDALFWSWAMPR